MKEKYICRGLNSNLPIREDRLFRRDEIMNKLANETSTRILMWGQSGFGKSTIAKEYCEMKKAENEKYFNFIY
jgi:ATP/maltotriose-dependent transcriptional regulator MalT